MNKCSVAAGSPRDWQKMCGRRLRYPYADERVGFTYMEMGLCRYVHG